MYGFRVLWLATRVCPGWDAWSAGIGFRVLGLAGPNQPYKDSAMSEFHQFLIDPNMEHECGILIASFHAQSMEACLRKAPDYTKPRPNFQ